LDKFFVAASFKAFGNIGHGRDGGPLDLVSETKILCESTVSGALIDFSGQQTGFLPGDDILESLNAHVVDLSNMKRRTLNLELMVLDSEL